MLILYDSGDSEAKCWHRVVDATQSTVRTAVNNNKHNVLDTFHLITTDRGIVSFTQVYPTNVLCTDSIDSAEEAAFRSLDIDTLKTSWRSFFGFGFALDFFRAVEYYL